MTPKQLAASLGLTTSAVTTLLDRLEAMDLLHRRPHPHDRRSVLVAASDKAERLAEEILEGYMRSVACVLDTLDGDADVDRIVRTMARLAQVSKTVGVDTACSAGEARATA